MAFTNFLSTESDIQLKKVGILYCFVCLVQIVSRSNNAINNYIQMTYDICLNLKKVGIGLAKLSAVR
jgi:hypothetical protein